MRPSNGSSVLGHDLAYLPTPGSAALGSDSRRPIPAEFAGLAALRKSPVDARNLETGGLLQSSFA